MIKRKARMIIYMGIIACLLAGLGVVSAKPSLSKLRKTNVSLQMVGFEFGSGLSQDNQGNYSGDGLEIFQQSWCGSGFVIDEDGTIATNYHVARRALQGVAKFDDGSQYDIGHIKVYDPEQDIAILKLRGSKKFETVEMGNSNDVDVMYDVYAAGNGLCRELAVTEGTINQIIKDDQGERVFFRHSAAIAPGNSGGPLYSDNKVIGINVLTRPPYEIHYAIPINQINRLLQYDNTILLQDAFPPDIESMTNKAKQVFARNGQAPARVGDEIGKWSISTDLFELMDALIIVESQQGTDLAITVHDSQNQLIGYADQRGTNIEALVIPTEFKKTVYITVWNYDTTPANFGISLYEIVW
jgi:hypothetical protein